VATAAQASNPEAMANMLWGIGGGASNS